MGSIQLLAPVAFLTGKYQIKLLFLISREKEGEVGGENKKPAWCNVVVEKGRCADSYWHAPVFQVLVIESLQSFSRPSLHLGAGKEGGQGVELEPHHAAAERQRG